MLSLANEMSPATKDPGKYPGWLCLFFFFLFLFEGRARDTWMFPG